MDPLDIIARSGDAAFATDDQGRIIIWNRATEQLLGYSAARVLGKPCHEVLCGRDVFGNRYCDEQCALSQMVRRGEPVHRFEMEVRTESGEMLSAGFSMIVVPGARSGRYTLIHFLQPVDRDREIDSLIRRVLAGAAGPTPTRLLHDPAPSENVAPLTQREIEVLRLLADGIGTRQIADSLFISVTTTRNHIQNILRKMDVHSKLEAVALAFRNHFI